MRSVTAGFDRMTGVLRALQQLAHAVRREGRRVIVTDLRARRRRQDAVAQVLGAKFLRQSAGTSQCVWLRRVV
jgi:hypothetical protein